MNKSFFSRHFHFFPLLGETGVGLVARDYKGNVLACRCSFRPYIFYPTVVEAVAAWMVVDFCRTMEVQHVELEGDSLVVIQALKNEDCNRSRYKQLIEDAKIILKCMQSWQVGHKREANRVAHRLAMEAVHYPMEKNGWIVFQILFEIMYLLKPLMLLEINEATQFLPKKNKKNEKRDLLGSNGTVLATERKVGSCSKRPIVTEIDCR